MKLDVKDQKILQELDLNPKITTSQLGKNVRLSQQVVDYRINKLVENKIITGFGTVINLANIGFEQYRLLFQLSDVNEEVKHKLIEYLKNHSRIYWAALVGGKWDLLVVVFVRNYDELEEFLDDIFTRFPKALKDYDAIYAIRHEFYKHKFLHFNKTLPVLSFNLSSLGEKVELDKVDLCILNQLKSNCRFSSLQIGNKCSVTYKTVQNRVKNLEKQELIIGYRLFIKSEEMNYKAYLLLISFSEYGRDIEKKIFSYARNHKEITQATKIFGRWSLLFHIRAKNEKELQNLIIEIRNTYPIIGNYEIIPIFEDILINHFPMSKELLNQSK